MKMFLIGYAIGIFSGVMLGWITLSMYIADQLQ